MKLSRPYLQIGFLEEKKSVIVMPEESVNCAGKQIQVVKAYDGSIYEKGDILIVSKGTEIFTHKTKDELFYFISEGQVIASY